MPETGSDKTLTGWRRVALEWSDVPLRAALAATFVCHGYQKIFGEGGVGAFAKHLPPQVPAPEYMAWLAALAEFAGGIAIALGLFTRIAALGHMAVMAVAISTVHVTQGFMAHDGKGYEWQVALFCMALCLFLRGAGPLSLDRIISGYWRSRPVTAAKRVTGDE
ncbi:MAG: DoxX family protein [Planctomycetota bacterium]